MISGFVFPEAPAAGGGHFEPANAQRPQGADQGRVDGENTGELTEGECLE